MKISPRPVAIGPMLGSMPSAAVASCLLQAFVDQLTREVDVGAVVEHDRHLRQSVARQRAGVVELRQARHAVLDQERHALLDFQRRIAGRRGIDLHLHVGDVGHGIDRQAQIVEDAERDERCDADEDQPPLRDGHLDDSVQHDASLSDRGLRLTFRCRP